MSLPFLKPKQVAGVIIRKRDTDGSSTEQPTESNDDHGLKACAADLIRAVHAKDEDAVAMALRAAIDCVEAERLGDDNSYDAQNEKAALKE